MKQLIIVVAAVLALALAACAQKTDKPKEQKQMKTLVAYFSCTGTTRLVAKQLAEVAGADLYEIAPKQAYTAADLDWTVKTSRSSVEMADSTSRPEIGTTVEGMDQYDVIYVGFPIWWYTAPTIINTFLESYDLKGKTLIPFATSGGSTIKKSCEDLRRTYPQLTWKEGRLLNGATKKQLEDWVKTLK